VIALLGKSIPPPPVSVVIDSMCVGLDASNSKFMLLIMLGSILAMHLE
jgi:hypothetical protein